MAKSYQLAPTDVQELLTSERELHHGVLDRCGVTLVALFVADIDEETGELNRCLMHHGYPAAAEIKITPIKQRVLGVADAIVTIDLAAWDSMRGKQRRALLDHELCHLQVKAVGRGIIKEGDGRLPAQDDAGRPVLRLRNHDWQLGGFYEVARRHGEEAVEVIDVRRHRDDNGQYFLDFCNVKSAGQILDDIAERTAAVASSRAQPGVEA